MNRKTFLAVLLVVSLLLSVPALAVDTDGLLIQEPVAMEIAAVAKPTTSDVFVDGVRVNFEAYNIGDNNYFKLRDLAYILSESTNSFEVEWDEMNKVINLVKGMNYTPVGGEMKVSNDLVKLEANLNESIIQLEGEEIDLTAYTINGNNYFKLRDVGEVMGFEVTWDEATQKIGINTLKAKPIMISGDDNAEYGGADGYGNSGDHANSPYWVNPDFYNMKSNDNLIIIPKYKTFNQTTEYSCGAASALTVLNHFGIDEYTEWNISVAGNVHTDEDVEGAEPGSANNFYEYGANVRKLYEFFETVPKIEIVETSYIEDYEDDDLIKAEDGFTPNDIGNLNPTFLGVSLYASENSDDTELWVEDAKDSYFVKWVMGHLENNRPIMVEWGDWDGHWMAIIGYDTLGTPSIGDDVIIFADPYDTSDHWQDGYYYYPAERWFYMWKDRNIAEKPFQLQPYIIVDIVE